MAFLITEREQEENIGYNYFFLLLSFFVQILTGRKNAQIYLQIKYFPTRTHVHVWTNYSFTVVWNSANTFNGLHYKQLFLYSL